MRTVVGMAIVTELGISQAQFARTIGVSPMRVSHVVNGKRPVTAALAFLFGRTGVSCASKGKELAEQRRRQSQFAAFYSFVATGDCMHV
ncbi:MAG: helix-turn-helix domain-containing protein [Planctomycetes bacterium]|nr:helix-turn-helix domain-containing protein [Planctomycetota bacterium]